MSRRKSGAVVAIFALLAAVFTPLVVAGPALAAPVCDLGDFEIDGNLTEQDCPPGFDDWLTPGIGFNSTEQGGTYSASSKDVDDPSTWTSAGSTPDKADFSKVYTLARVVDGHYYLYVAWDRTGDSGTGKYAIDLSFAGREPRARRHAATAPRCRRRRRLHQHGRRQCSDARTAVPVRRPGRLPRRRELRPG